MHPSPAENLRRAFAERARPPSLFRSDYSGLLAADAAYYEEKLRSGMDVQQILGSLLNPFSMLTDRGKAYLLPDLLTEVERDPTRLIDIAALISNGHFSFLDTFTPAEREAVAAYVSGFNRLEDKGIPLTEWYAEEISTIQQTLGLPTREKGVDP